MGYMVVILLFVGLITFVLIGNMKGLEVEEEDLVLDDEGGVDGDMVVLPDEIGEDEEEDDVLDGLPLPPQVNGDVLEKANGGALDSDLPEVDGDREKVRGLVKIDHIVVGDQMVDHDVDMKRRKIREGFVHCYGGYEDLCFGSGQLRPVSGECKEEPFASGLKLTTIDSLDTLLIMELDDYYIRARESLRDLDFEIDSKASVFETNIRLIGGLLSAYAITHDEVLLQKCEELATKLMVAFDTPTGIPMSWVVLNTGETGMPSWSGKAAILSELGTLQLEWAYLSHLTGNPIFAEKALHVFDQLLSIRPDDGLYPVYIKTEKLEFRGQVVSAGALADSFYEYLLKLWLLTGKKDDTLKKWFFQEADDLMKGLGVDIGNGMYYLREKNGGGFQDKMEHLTCFAGGLFALGSLYADDENLRDRMMEAGKGIGKFCYEMYKMNPTGLPTEFVNVRNGKLSAPPPKVYGSQYLMRPEAVETWFILYRITKDPIYRQYGWEFFQAIETVTKTEYGYSGLLDATAENPVLDDNQQSFFLAETMKYLYLLFSPDTVIPLDKFVFNTEAHPFPLGAEIDFFLKKT